LATAAIYVALNFGYHHVATNRHDLSIETQHGQLQNAAACQGGSEPELFADRTPVVASSSPSANRALPC